jgi:hypothetical protein
VPHGDRPASFGYIYLDDGRVVYANVLNRPDRLGELLVRNQVIDREKLSRAMEDQALDSRGQRLGQILVDRGDITEEELLRFITVQIEEAVYHLFSGIAGPSTSSPTPAPTRSRPRTSPSTPRACCSRAHAGWTNGP